MSVTGLLTACLIAVLIKSLSRANCLHQFAVLQPFVETLVQSEKRLFPLSFWGMCLRSWVKRCCRHNTYQVAPVEGLKEMLTLKHQFSIFQFNVILPHHWCYWTHISPHDRSKCLGKKRKLPTQINLTCFLHLCFNV